MEQVLGQMGIPLVLAVLLIYYAVKILVFKDIDAIRPPSFPRLEGEKRDAYARDAGILIVIFGVCSVIMAGLMLLNTEVGFLWILICTGLVFYRFRKIEEKYSGEGKK